MNTENAVPSRNDDVVFENRNKAYGAYSIRRTYQENLSKGSLSSFLFMMGLLVAAQVAMIMKPDIVASILPKDKTRKLTHVKVIADPPAKREVRTTPVKRTDASVKVVTTEVPDQPKVDVVVASFLPTGIEGPGESGPEVETPGTSDVPVVTESKPLDFAEVMPEYPGGAAALYKFLKKNLRYPSIASQRGVEGAVYVRFIVDQNGEITDIEVIKNVDVSLDKEAARVISKMPNWKPGRQHGSSVSVRMVLPIKFALSK
ncbi:cell envelope biogenesis protein TonB [Cytophagales bacterium WSM2-2]|nr:cell envelope biogenesis protein TonB [Cytophagales bacterium WSM2-2]